MKTFGKIVLWLVGIFFVLQVFGFILVYASKRIRPNTVLTLRIEGDIPEQPPRNPLAELLTGPRTTVTDIVEALDRARTDPRITGIHLRVGESTMNMAKVQEVRERIREFSRAGKFSVVFLEFATNRSYYLASAGQTVFLLPASVLYVRGMMVSTTFYRGLLDKVGIYPDLYHIGDYKNASNVYTERKYTPAHREATQTLLEDWYNEFLRGIAEGRGLTPQQVARAIERGPLTSQEALAAKLVDRVAYADEAQEFVKQQNHGSESRLSLREYLRRSEREARSKLAVIYATGEILPGRSGEDAFGETIMGSDTIAEQFRRAREDDSLKAVILRVDSPGGAPFSSEVIRREVVMTKRVKPVVVSMSDLAASGGYWISMSASKIVAEPGTITGSIGVYLGKFNLTGLYQKLGLTKDFIATTENATLEWPFKNFTPTQRVAVEKQMRDTYSNFLAGVAEGRRMKPQDVDKLGQGRVWTGERARQLGLVDELGGLHTAIALARQLAKIPPSEKVSLVYLPAPKSLLEKILELAATSSDDAPAPLGLGFGQAFSPREWIRALKSLAQERVWTLLPAVPELK